MTTEGADLQWSLNKLWEAEQVLQQHFRKRVEKSTEEEKTTSDNEKVIESKLLSITYNNFACLYKRKKNPEEALKYLETALEAERDQLFLAPNKVEANTEHAGTHLNICAILSQLKRHWEAIKVAKQALDVLTHAD